MRSPKRPPEPRGLPIVGILPTFVFDLLGLFEEAARYGDLVMLRTPGQVFYVVNHPELMKEVLATRNRKYLKMPYSPLRPIIGNGLVPVADPEAHARQRRLVQPAFHKQRIAGFADTIIHMTDAFISRWQDGTRLNLSFEMAQLAMQVVVKCLFSADIRNESSELTTAFHLFTTRSPPPGLTFLFGRWIEKLFPLIEKRFERNLEVLDAFIYRLIREYRTQDRDTGDLLSMLIHAVDEGGDGTGLTDRQARDEAMTLFAAGHETTAVAISWTFYLLSQHPDVEARLQAELDTVLAGRLPTLEDVPRLKYTRMVFSESMRVYPPAWMQLRLAVEDDRLGGYDVPAGTRMLLSPYLMHHHPGLWDAPEVFRPERFDPDSGVERHRYAFCPFGGGPRACVGEAFSWLEGTLVLAIVHQRFRLRLQDGARVVPFTSVTLQPKGGLPMVVHRRGAA